MKNVQRLLCLIALAYSSLNPASGAGEISAAANKRFAQASNRTFQWFDSQREHAWQGPYFFLQLADTQYGMFTRNTGLEQEAALAQQAVEHINRLRPKFVIVCGDLTNANPSHDRYQAQVNQYKQDFSKIDADIPLVCVCGNHDIGNRPTAKTIASYSAHFGDDYFSFWVGGVFNIVLNSTVIKDPAEAPEILAAQQAWLNAQLATVKENPAKHVFVFMHHPLFLKQPDEPDIYPNMPLIRRTPLLEQLKQAGVRAIFAGHYHRNSYGKFENMEMITTGPIGKPLGKDPSGFRIVEVYDGRIQHQYYGMGDVPDSIDLKQSDTPKTNQSSTE